ncbi:MAG: T9SS type A sorting domain-containing protein [Chitinophagaceae bacterium]|nr:T9SS type A sorting domain-containing protein [Chitinophagaceae bacterium]
MIVFPNPGVYSVTCTVSRGTTTITSSTVTVTVYNANLWATSSGGTIISAFGVNAGSYIAGPTDIFAPITGAAGSTAALAISAPQPGLNPGDPATPYFYWLPNTTGNSGVVDVYGATMAGTNQTLIGTLDVNGANTDNLGFVRLGMGPNGVCYLLAGNGSTTVYLASFKPNGVTVNSSLPVADRLKVDDANGVTLAGGGSAADFQNGDLAVLPSPSSPGGVAIYALANVTNGTTEIFIGSPNGNNTTFTRRWNLVDGNNGNQSFSGSVNGVAFDLAGSMYLSTSVGIYFVNSATVNSAGPGTVVTTLVRAQTGLQDLASNAFPSGSTLPVKLKNFSGILRNNIATLNWESESEENFDYYEVERSTSPSQFRSVAKRNPLGTSNSGNSYSVNDDVSAESSKVFYYRLKMADKDGRTEYSNIVMLRRDNKQIKNLLLTPNPVQGVATARIEMASAGVVTLRVMDGNGRTIHQQRNNVNAGVNAVSILNVSTLQPGTYILQMIDSNGEISSAKFSKF